VTDRDWTVGELAAWTRDRFAQAGLEEAKLDAELLLAHALGCTRLETFVEHARLVGAPERATFRELVRRRLEGEPVAYIRGRRDFHALDLELRVDRRVLIPRPETEHLVDWALESLRPPPAPPTAIVDVGTGSGAIALAIRRARPDIAVTAVDIDPEALELARDNARALDLEVELACSDLLGEVPVPAGGWAAVLANLPYIPTAELDALDRGPRAFEPRRALDGGPDGLGPIRRLVEQVAAPGTLASGGLLFLEVGLGQAPSVVRTLQQAGLTAIDVRRDLAGIERIVRGRAP
jgi:release factor glutamine methyltransferase